MASKYSAFISYSSGNAGTVSNLAGQAISVNTNPNNSTSALVGATGATLGQIGNIREVVTGSSISKFTKAGGALGMLQVGINAHNNYKDTGSVGETIGKVTVGDMLTTGAAVAAMIPGGQLVAVGLTVAGLGYTIWENKNGAITLKDIIKSHPDNNRQDDWGNPENQKNWCDPNDWKEWQDSVNRDGKYHIVDPLVLDLDGDGIETVGAQGYSGALFDHDKD
ncbi:hypothetical protein EGK75_12910, partial [Neisseria weixii]